MLYLQERNPIKTRGAMNAERSPLSIRQFAPQKPSAVPWLKHIWMVEWALSPDQNRTQWTVPYPAFNLVADPQKEIALWGCPTRRFGYELTGEGYVVGFRFHPTTQTAFYPDPASQLADRKMLLDGAKLPELATILDPLCTRKPDIQALANTLTALAPLAKALNADNQLVREIVDHIAGTSDLFRVDALCAHYQLNERKLQRLFARYLGLSPKSVIERYRLQEALEHLKSGDLGLADLALRLGYSDQAHFTNSFRNFTGYTPKQYVNWVS